VEVGLISIFFAPSIGLLNEARVNTRHFKYLQEKKNFKYVILVIKDKMINYRGTLNNCNRSKMTGMWLVTL